MKRKLTSYLVAVVFAMGTMLTLTGCTSAQLSTTLSIIQTDIPTAVSLAANLVSTADPALAPVCATINAAVQADAPILAAAIQAWQANQSAGNLAAVKAALNTLATTINAQVLAANKVANNQTDALILTAIGGIALLVNGWVSHVNGAMTPAATKTARVIRNWPNGQAIVDAAIRRDVQTFPSM